MPITTNNINSVESINRIDLVEYLGLLGLHPAVVKGQQYRYFSPFRPEPFPSFVVQRESNTWRDGSDLRRHNLLDFGVRFYGGTIGELFATFNQALSAQLQKTDPLQHRDPLAIDPVTVVGKFPLRSQSLGSYLKERRIPWDIARQFCIQIDLQGPGRMEKTLAFANNAGGYYLRNSNINSFLGPRGFSLIDAQASVCAVFIDFEDFLSYQGMVQNQPQALTNFLILHSSAFAARSFSIMEAQQKVQLFLPRSDEGVSLTRDLCAASQKYFDRSQLYTN